MNVVSLLMVNTYSCAGDQMVVRSTPVHGVQRWRGRGTDLQPQQHFTRYVVRCAAHPVSAVQCQLASCVPHKILLQGTYAYMDYVVSVYVTDRILSSLLLCRYSSLALLFFLSILPMCEPVFSHTCIPQVKMSGMRAHSIHTPHTPSYQASTVHTSQVTV